MSETCSTCRCLSLLALALVVAITVAASRLVSAIRNQTDVHLCLEAARVLDEVPKPCSETLGITPSHQPKEGGHG